MTTQSNQNFVAYYRVSTKKQDGEMPAQKTAVKNYLKNHYPPVKSFTEVESGGKSDRPVLLEALSYCREHNCKLVVAKLDRLSRDLGFIANLQKSNVEFVCADMPEANSLTISLLACLAQWERDQIAKRTRLALAEKRRQGVKLGYHNPKVKAGVMRRWAKHKKRVGVGVLKITKAKPPIKVIPSKRELADKAVLPQIRILRKAGHTFAQIAQIFNKSKVETRQGGKWSDIQVLRISKRNNVA